MKTSFLVQFFRYNTNLVISFYFLFFTLSIALYTSLSAPILEPDSIGYQETAEEPFSIVNTLTSIRTPIYPLLLRFSKDATGSFGPVLVFQSLIYAFSVYYLFFQLTKAGFKAWVAISSTTPLFFSPILYQFGHAYLTETLGTGIAISSFASTIPFLVRKENRFDLLALAVTSFLAILTRPAFLFIPLFVFFALWTLRPREIGRDSLISHTKKSLLPLIATVIPLLFYSLLRLIVVGHFGLVSFGGTNLAGLALNPSILTTEVANQFEDKETREAAKAILIKRKELLANGIPSLPDTPSYLLDEKEFSNQPLLETWSAAYNISCWNVGVPAVAAHLDVPETRGTPTWALVNKTLSKVSRSAVIANPIPYVRWIFVATTETYQNFFRVESLQCKLISLFLLTITILTVCNIISSIQLKSIDIWKVSTCLTALLFTTILLGNNYYLVISTLFFLCNGTIAPVLIPGLFLAYSICYVLFKTILDIRNLSSAPCIYSIILAASALYFLSGLLLVVLVEIPLDRYLLAIIPPFSVGIFLGLTQACDYLLNKRILLFFRSSRQPQQEVNAHCP
jgi:hypothetical protein